MPADSRDLLIVGGSIVDGTGSPGVSGDVRLHDGRIVEIGPRLRRDGEMVFDAEGAVVAPGFLDLHTHLDPQLFWDPACDPQPQHGVTTALIGNCSLSLFPVSDAQRHAIADLFAFVEDVPIEPLERELPWTWSDYAGYRDAVTASGCALNIAALIGHSPLRLVAMGEAAWERVATPEERATMAALLDDAMRAGAWGLSTSFFDVDRRGRPVPSRWADDEEFDVLLDVLAAHATAFVEFVPDLAGPEPEVGMERLASRCGARGLPLTWTGFTAMHSNPARTAHWLEVTRRFRAEGVDFWPQLSPRSVDMRMNWDGSMMFMQFTEGWHQVIQARGAAKRDLLLDGAWRSIARAEWDAIDGKMFPNRRLDRVRFVEVTNRDEERWLGRTLEDLVAERGGHPSDVFADFVLANDCRPGIVAVGMANADPELVARTFADENVLVSSSDAGAHLQMFCASGDTTLLLTRHVRERGDLTLERAVHELTGRLARAFGFRDRGVIAPGMAGDLVVFALDELHWDDDELVADLPGGASRFRRPEGGYRATIVNGVPVQIAGELTGATPGIVLPANT
jgi:N-acyl-D-aspartate/D-glutamate deacylase